MNLIDITNRQSPPEPWSEGDNIPWNEPGFSSRMLKEHLTQEHDMASRKLVNVERHVNWIHEKLLGGSPAHILDMGCGPGLYTSRLAQRGHTCTGIDFSPASIEYAMQSAGDLAVRCSYVLSDLRLAHFGPEQSYDLAMLIFGELNVFRPADIRLILKKASRALKPGGLLLLEVSDEKSVREMGSSPTSWYTQVEGLFSSRPHLLLQESFWDEASRAATKRFFVIDAETAQVQRFASSQQAYSNPELQDLLVECGFENVHFYPSLAGAAGELPEGLIAITAEQAG